MIKYDCYLSCFDDNLFSFLYHFYFFSPIFALLQDEFKTEPGTVIAADFYHSNTLMPLSDAEIINRVKRNIDTCEPIFKTAKVRVYIQMKL